MGVRGRWDSGSPKRRIPAEVVCSEGVGQGERWANHRVPSTVFLIFLLVLFCVEIQNFQNSFALFTKPSNFKSFENKTKHGLQQNIIR